MLDSHKKQMTKKMPLVVEKEGLLVVILDVNRFFWGGSDAPEITLKETIESVLLFVRAYLLLHRNNRLVLVCAHDSGKSEFLFPNTECSDVSGSAEQFSQSQQYILNQFATFLQAKNSGGSTAEQKRKTGISSALSKSLCFVSRVLNESKTIQPRVLIVQKSPDVSEHYISLMNCLFSAQKLKIPVDACVLSKQHSSFLQQACYLTSGIYFQPVQQRSLTQYFFSIWLADEETRIYLKLPKLESVDFRAMCFCHRTFTEVAFVCPVCLSLFCEFMPICSTCGVRSRISRLNSSTKKKTYLNSKENFSGGKRQRL